eukprot:TRINITY_DN11292_c0_g1_i1.p2 TRINITY_DN11292_c0_g1~~TRINITY_DN11292_c0_g1_i1.p2  ORF type:complete len:563 (+),score=167.68 TRINITY_DN11292_c0_g1_i1:97-1689(+)
MSVSKQCRRFYLGSLRGCHGRLHPSLENEDLGGVHEKPMDAGTWEAVWNKGPLFLRVSHDDTQMSYKRYARREAETDEVTRMFAPFRKQYSRQQKLLNARTREGNDANSRLFETRYNLEDSWEGRVSLDWTRLSEDSAIRLLLWEIYGPSPNTPSPPTTPSLEQLAADLIRHCKARGDIPHAERRSLELWTEATYFAVAHSKTDELAGLSEAFVGHARDELSANRGDAHQLISPYRQVLTGFYLPPTSSVVEAAPCRELEDAGKVVSDLQKVLGLARWYRGVFLPEAANDKRVYLAEQNGMLDVRRKMVSEMAKRKMLDRTQQGVADAGVRGMEDALREVETKDAAWRRVQVRRGKQMQAEQAHLLQSIPVEHVSYSPYLVEREAVSPDEEVKVSATYQHHLAEHLANPLHKKCLVVAGPEAEEKLRSSIYELAWLETKEAHHDIYSQQRKEVNEQVQRARRKVEVALRKISEDSDHADAFEPEMNVPSRRDVLFAPDQHAHSLATVTVTRNVAPFTSGGFADTAPGVHA